jgi:hypothetical protein
MPRSPETAGRMPAITNSDVPMAKAAAKRANRASDIRQELR